MTDDDMELVRGSGNIYRDFDRPNASLAQARAIVAANIIRTMDEQGLSSREAARKTGIAHTEFSRIRNAHLQRFTLDRMITILGKLDQDVDISISINTRSTDAAMTTSFGIVP